MDDKAVAVKVFEQAPAEFTGDLLVVLMEEKRPQSAAVGKPFERMFEQILATGDFSGRQDETFLFYPGLVEKKSPIAARRLLLLGLGIQESTAEGRLEQLRLAGGNLAKQAKTLKARNILLVLPKGYLLDEEDVAASCIEGFLLGLYSFDRYKTPKPQETGKGRDAGDAPVQVESFLVYDDGHSTGAVNKGVQKGEILARAVCVARDMANQPANEWTPAAFAEYAKKLAKKGPLKCKTLDKGDLVKRGMGGLVGVNQGSAQPPFLVVLEYRTNKQNPTVLLVGKGLTFDSGGICVKPSAGMEDMKYDMCGGAAVLATMQAVAELGMGGVNVVGLVPTTENMIGSAALKPGDIIRHFGGKTSEVVNTDAEGRLILADALAYGIATYAPEAVVDLATLTGAVIIGLGHHYTGVLSNNDQLVERLVAAGAKVGEPLWRLPLGPEYRKQIDSRVADIKNAGSDRSAGTITAACYLEEFVGETPWAHLDIAGTAWDFTEKSYVPKGPSGTGVRTLVTLLGEWKKLQSRQKKLIMSATGPSPRDKE